MHPPPDGVSTEPLGRHRFADFDLLHASRGATQRAVSGHKGDFSGPALLSKVTESLLLFGARW